jgi:hypothetical protein
MPSVINGREWRDDDQARSQAAVEAEPRKLKRTEPMTRRSSLLDGHLEIFCYRAWMQH